MGCRIVRPVFMPGDTKMRTIANFLWHIPFLGFLNALYMFVLGLILTVTVIASPIGLGLIEYSKFLLAPYSRIMINDPTPANERNQLWRAYSFIVMIVYLPFGLISAVMAIFQIIGLVCSIIGIPLAIIIFKSLGTCLNPVGKKCVHHTFYDSALRSSGATRGETTL